MRGGAEGGSDEGLMAMARGGGGRRTETAPNGECPLSPPCSGRDRLYRRHEERMRNDEQVVRRTRREGSLLGRKCEEAGWKRRNTPEHHNCEDAGQPLPQRLEHQLTNTYANSDYEKRTNGNGREAKEEKEEAVEGRTDGESETGRGYEPIHLE